jgi:hypothetical protein
MKWNSLGLLGLGVAFSLFITVTATSTALLRCGLNLRTSCIFLFLDFHLKNENLPL